jgi:hypothetical protein
MSEHGVEHQFLIKKTERKVFVWKNKERGLA